MNMYSEAKPHYIKRLFWMLLNVTLFRVLIGVKFHGCRNFLLRLFGADVHHRCLIYPSCRIFAPWNLRVGKFATLGPKTEIYNKGMVEIGENSIVSQGVFLCTASHDVSSLLLPLDTAPIIIGANCWVAADAFVGPGVKIGNGAVVGARSAVFKDVIAWSIVGGNPAEQIKMRELIGDE